MRFGFITRRARPAGSEAGRVADGAAQKAPGRASDFGFHTGQWRVKHRKLARWLEGASDWIEFEGDCRAWGILDGAGSVAEHTVEDPAGTFRLGSMRRRDPVSGLWSIWCYDQRFPALPAPLQGAFREGVGIFFGNDVHEGRPVRVRFFWSRINADRARWEQAYSPDEGGTWEVNWTMDFERQ